MSALEQILASESALPKQRELGIKESSDHNFKTIATRPKTPQIIQQSHGSGHGTQKQNRPGHKSPRPPRRPRSASVSG